MDTIQTNAEPLVKEVLLDALVERVWKALTDKEEMRKWYFDIKEFKPEVGFQFQFSAGNEGRLFVHLCQITDVEVNKKLSYSWMYEGQNIKTYVSFELFPEGKKTRLRLTHKGLEKLPQDKDFARSNFMQGWTHFIDKAIKEYVEK